jgi:uncharacterized protein YyaL (SSP411 family)
LDNTNKKSNRLIHSLSPYLQQHAYNPVDWHEWGEEAFEKARAENKLLLVSIGYSACHWCHVMAHECFEDNETADIMNRYFICIKIDREELPDVDQVYMDACQLINGSGGWPLNAFALPDKRPIHALTYQPRNQWQKTLSSIHGLWENNPSAAEDYAQKLSRGIAHISMPPEMNTSQNTGLTGEQILKTFIDHYDPVYGGPNRAPKFPMPNNYLYLLQYGHAAKNSKAREMGLFTLQQMALGGIYDAVGGGFSRYSVDERWFAPHFEKMLYDNAQLISLYSYAYAISKNDFYKKIAVETIDFCMNELYGYDDLYYSAYDADSEGVEGLYYTYTYDELELLLGRDATLFCQYFQCIKSGNWEHGRNILFALDTIENAAAQLEIEKVVLHDTVSKGLKILNAYRDKRIKPGLDDKYICSWNNLMLKGLAESTLWLDDTKYLDRASLLADTILSTFYADGHLKRIAKNATVKIQAFLEDYATLIDGLISLYQSGFNEKYLLQAKMLCETVISGFYKPEKGFFEFNSSGTLIAPKYDISDDVINSGNSIMAHNLWKLSWYFDQPEWRIMAENMLQAVTQLLQTSAPWYSNWARLQIFSEYGTQQVILAGDESLRTTMPLQSYSHIPNIILGFAGIETQIPLLKEKKYKDKNLVYMCTDFTCEAPVEFINAR